MKTRCIFWAMLCYSGILASPGCCWKNAEGTNTKEQTHICHIWLKFNDSQSCLIIMYALVINTLTNYMIYASATKQVPLILPFHQMALPHAALQLPSPPKKRKLLEFHPEALNLHLAKSTLFRKGVQYFPAIGTIWRSALPSSFFLSSHWSSDHASDSIHIMGTWDVSQKHTLGGHTDRHWNSLRPFIFFHFFPIVRKTNKNNLTLIEQEILYFGISQLEWHSTKRNESHWFSKSPRQWD